MLLGQTEDIMLNRIQDQVIRVCLLMILCPEMKQILIETRI